MMYHKQFFKELIKIGTFFLSLAHGRHLAHCIEKWFLKFIVNKPEN